MSLYTVCPPNPTSKSSNFPSSPCFGVVALLRISHPGDVELQDVNVVSRPQGAKRKVPPVVSLTRCHRWIGIELDLIIYSLSFRRCFVIHYINYSTVNLRLTTLTSTWETSLHSCSNPLGMLRERRCGGRTWNWLWSSVPPSKQSGDGKCSREW